MEPLEKKKRRKTTAKKNSSSPPSTHPSFSLLPDEITVNFLARIPRSYYPRLSIVSRSFRSLLSSAELYAARSHLRSTEECLYVCLWDHRNSYESPQWYRLWINPNRIKKKRKKIIKQLLVPIPSSDFASIAKPITVGSEIYVIGGPIDNKPSSAVRVLDCCSHTWRDAPSLNVARKNARACVYNGKIYVIGGVKDEESSYAEVFDTKTQTWECLPDPGSEIRKCYLFKIVEVDGTINFGSSRKMYGYNTKQGKWESSVNIYATFARSACVIENESYDGFNWYGMKWRDINGGHSKLVNGLDSLQDKYMRYGDSSYCTTSKLASCGGNLYFMWEGYRKSTCNRKKKIWCAEISLEKRDGGEIWGNVEWIDAVHIVPKSCKLLHIVTVSV